MSNILGDVDAARIARALLECSVGPHQPV